MCRFPRWSIVALLLLVTLAGCQRGGPAESGTDPLVGQKAPPFSTTLADGTRFELADYLGQKVILLDFWATWCGPCVAAMPIVAEVAQEYRDRGVVLFPVNQGESPEEVVQFLKDKGLELNVVMDPEQTISTHYGVQYLPHMVIIGRDGTVRAVHVGSQPGLKSALAGELDAILGDQQAASL